MSSPPIVKGGDVITHLSDTSGGGTGGGGSGGHRRPWKTRMERDAWLASLLCEGRGVNAVDNGGDSTLPELGDDIDAYLEAFIDGKKNMSAFDSGSDSDRDDMHVDQNVAGQKSGWRSKWKRGKDGVWARRSSAARPSKNNNLPFTKADHAIWDTPSTGQDLLLERRRSSGQLLATQEVQTDPQGKIRDVAYEQRERECMEDEKRDSSRWRTCPHIKTRNKKQETNTKCTSEHTSQTYSQVWAKS